jgi:hypothetical protein
LLEANRVDIQADGEAAMMASLITSQYHEEKARWRP